MEIIHYKKKKKIPTWKFRKPPYQVTKDDFTNKDIKTDYDGWVDPKLYRPEPYELVIMKLERKTISGWWTGHKWEGLRLIKGDKILYWKSKENREEEE